MPRLWPDPRDDKPERRWWIWFVGATIAAFFIANIGRGLAGMGWNW